MKKKKIQPEKVVRVVCPKCGELQLKIYPWSNIIWGNQQQIPTCKKCQNKPVVKK